MGREIRLNFFFTNTSRVVLKQLTLSLGLLDGEAVGALLGLVVGEPVGIFVGPPVGVSV